MNGGVVLRRFGGLWRTRAAVAEVSTAAGVSYNSRRPSRPLHTSIRREHLSRQARGVKVWEDMTQNRAGEEFDLKAECEKMVENLKLNRYTKSSTLTKIYDNVATVEQLDLAEKALLSFRRSLSQPTPALPLVVVRACLRAESPQKALHYIRNKVMYGVFPSRRVCNVLMDAFIRIESATGAIAVYKQMLEDEVVPDGMTFHLASRAHGMLGTEEGAEEAESLCRQCHELEPKLGCKSFIILVKTLLSQNKNQEALSLLSRLDQQQLLLPQTHLNLLMHALVADGELAAAMAALRERLCSDSPDTSLQRLGLPQEAWPQLQAAVQSSGDMELRQKLEKLEKDLTNIISHGTIA